MAKAAVNKTETVKDLKDKMTSEKAIKFLQEENEKQLKKGLEIFTAAIKEMEAIGCGINITNTLNAQNQIVNSVQVVKIK